MGAVCLGARDRQRHTFVLFRCQKAPEALRGWQQISNNVYWKRGFMRAVEQDYLKLLSLLDLFGLMGKI